MKRYNQARCYLTILIASCGIWWGIWTAFQWATN